MSIIRQRGDPRLTPFGHVSRFSLAARSEPSHCRRKKQPQAGTRQTSRADLRRLGEEPLHSRATYSAEV